MPADGSAEGDSGNVVVGRVMLRRVRITVPEDLISRSGFEVAYLMQVSTWQR